MLKIRNGSRAAAPKKPRTAYGGSASGTKVTGLLWVLLGACNGPAKSTFIDSEQRHFAAVCAKNGHCTLSPQTDPKANPSSPEKPRVAEQKESETRMVLRSVGRVVGVCGPVQTEQELPDLMRCRPLMCQSDADCPPAEGLVRGVCVNQLCIEPSHPIVTDDAALLCLAGTGAGEKTPEQVERFALGLNCGEPCRIPKVCRQP